MHGKGIFKYFYVVLDIKAWELWEIVSCLGRYCIVPLYALFTCSLVLEFCLHIDKFGDKRELCENIRYLDHHTTPFGQDNLIVFFFFGT